MSVKVQWNAANATKLPFMYANSGTPGQANGSLILNINASGIQSDYNTSQLPVSTGMILSVNGLESPQVGTFGDLDNLLRITRQASGNTHLTMDASVDPVMPDVITSVLRTLPLVEGENTLQLCYALDIQIVVQQVYFYFTGNAGVTLPATGVYENAILHLLSIYPHRKAANGAVMRLQDLQIATTDWAQPGLDTE